jgi:hypothetical protein
VNWQLIDSRVNEFTKKDAKENDDITISFNCQTNGKIKVVILLLI